MGPDRVAGGERGRVRGLPLVLVSLLVVGVAAAGVAIDRDGGGPKAGPGDAFYSLPKNLPVAAAGTIIRSAGVPAPAGAAGTKVLYHSRALDGRDIAVSGVIYTPTGAAP
ncbi:MAG: secretory lipase, partial [Actinomycetia bacterium]|nr:secretory lipase [Actinomycetes bacterium]